MTSTTVRPSKLNPLATTFVPSRPASSETAATRDMAQKLMQEVIESKKNCVNKKLTKQEFVDIVERLIIMRYNINKGETANIKAYLNSKILNRLSLKVSKACETSSDPMKECLKTLADPPPKHSSLLVSFWGLYRHEQAVRPMLSLSSRPEVVTDKTWSLTSEDLKLFNSSCSEICHCPPIFGYSLPPDFFGNPFNLSYSCPEKCIHLGRSPESVDGNELILIDKEKRSIEPLVDIFEEKVEERTDLDFYSDQLKTIVEGVCDLIADEDSGLDSADSGLDSADSGLEDDCPTKNEEPSEKLAVFWDSNYSREKMSNDFKDEDYHSLLEAEDLNAESVPPEFDAIQQIFSSDNLSNNTLSTSLEESWSTCESPCSIWCHPKVQRSDSAVSSSSTRSSVISLLNDTTDFLMSSSEFGLSNTTDLKCDWQKRSFKRSFSANDCDLSNEEKYTRLKVSQLAAHESLPLYKRSSCASPKPSSDIWCDSDSGITQWSSEEDVCETVDDKNCMWSLFSGEGSLWKPLPEHCNVKHKRVRELRRQRSLN